MIVKLTLKKFPGALDLCYKVAVEGICKMLEFITKKKNVSKPSTLIWVFPHWNFELSTTGALLKANINFSKKMEDVRMLDQQVMNIRVHLHTTGLKDKP
mmetsp:Transcript_17221/g.22101  ORF Transcript_17221/g.22101 Transcript_17221/m.22101 type:complete len:99 (+) Transcript_17221:471-767(+)